MASINNISIQNNINEPYDKRTVESEKDNKIDFIWEKYDKNENDTQGDGKIQENELRKALGDYMFSRISIKTVVKHAEDISNFVKQYVDSKWSEFKSEFVDNLIKTIVEKEIKDSSNNFELSE